VGISPALAKLHRIIAVPQRGGHIFYDGGCGICSAGVRRWGQILARHGFTLIPLQDPLAATMLARNPADPLPPEMQLLTTDGRLLGGVDAIGFIAGHFWWAFPVQLALRIPPIRAMARIAYRAFARHRHQISSACRLKPTLAPAHVGNRACARSSHRS